MSGINSAALIGSMLGEHWAFGEYVSRRNAAVLQISSLMMIVFCMLLVVAGSALIAGRHGSGPHGASRTSPVATTLALTSAMGLLLSSATVYLTYRPYWYIFQRAILNGDRSQARDLREFLMAVRTLPGFRPVSYYLLLNLPVYFWTGVTLLGVIGLVLIFLRHLRGRPSAQRVQNHPRVS